MYKYVLSILLISISIQANEAIFSEEVELLINRGDPGTIFQATITAVKVLTGKEGGHKFHITLTDSSKWATVGEEDFKTAIRSNWTIGDHIIIKEFGSVWEGFNQTRKTKVNLFYDK